MLCRENIMLIVKFLQYLLFLEQKINNLTDYVFQAHKYALFEVTRPDPALMSVLTLQDLNYIKLAKETASAI